jgi:hypothetical protein
MMKGVFSLAASGAFLCLLTNAALADESAPPRAPGQDRSLLSTWDKPAFSPGPSLPAALGLGLARQKASTSTFF